MQISLLYYTKIRLVTKLYPLVEPVTVSLTIYLVILKLLGFQKAPHFILKITSSLVTLHRSPKISQGIAIPTRSPTNPKDPITERQMMNGVYNHIQNARYFCSITILRR